MNEHERQTKLLEEILAAQKEQLKFLKTRERAYWKLSIWVTVAVLVVTVGIIIAIPWIEKQKRGQKGVSPHCPKWSQ